MRTDAPSKWFRLYSEFATDPKVQMLSEIDQRRYLMLLCLRCSNGNVTLQKHEIAFQLRISEAEFDETLKTLVTRKLVTSDAKPVSWEKRQYRSDTSAARVAKHREKKKQVGNGDVTLQSRPVEGEGEGEGEVNLKPFAEHEKIVFDGSSFKNINGQLKSWQAAYPAVDVELEINRAAAWLVSNPKNKKSQYARFLNAWLSKAQDRAPRVAASHGYAGNSV